MADSQTMNSATPTSPSLSSELSKSGLVSGSQIGVSGLQVSDGPNSPSDSNPTNSTVRLTTFHSASEVEPTNVPVTTTPTSIAPSVELDAAAIKIQALQRGRAARKLAEQEEKKRDAVLPTEPTPTADILIIDGREEAAIKIQALQRGRSVRLKKSSTSSISETDSQATNATSSTSAASTSSTNPTTTTATSTSTSSTRPKSSIPAWRFIVLIQRRFKRLKSQAQSKIRATLLRQRQLEEERIKMKLARGARRPNRLAPLQKGVGGDLAPPSPSFLAPPISGSPSSPSNSPVPALPRPSSLGRIARESISGSVSPIAKSPRMPQKAADLLYGGAKSHHVDKRLDMLGVSEKEMAFFDQAGDKAAHILGTKQLDPIHTHTSSTDEELVAIAAGERAAREAAEQARLEQEEKDAAAQLIRPNVTGKAAQVLMGIHKTERRGSTSSPDGLPILPGVRSPSRPTSCSPSPRPISSRPESPTHTPGGTSTKVYDKLGVTAKQLEMFPSAQSKMFTKLGVDVPLQASMLTDLNPHHLLHAKEDAEAQKLSDEQSQKELAQLDLEAHLAKKQTSKKVQDLTVGGHKKDKLLDKLGVSAKEMETFKSNQIAYRKLGLFAPENHDSHRKVESTVFLDAQEPPTPPGPFIDPATVKPASNVGLDKAQQVLYGNGKKVGEKDIGRLGITKKEHDKFAGQQGQKAYQKLGVFDTPEVMAARKSQAEGLGPYSARQMQAMQLLQTQNAQATLAAKNSTIAGSTPIAIAQQQQLAALQATRAQKLASMQGSKSSPFLPTASSAASSSPHTASNRATALINSVTSPYSSNTSNNVVLNGNGRPVGKLTPLTTNGTTTASTSVGGNKGWSKMKAKLAKSQSQSIGVVANGNTPGIRQGPGSLAAAARAGAQGGLSYSSSLKALRHDSSLPSLTNQPTNPKHSLFAVVLAANKNNPNARSKGVASFTKQLPLGAAAGSADLGFSVAGRAITPTVLVPQPSLSRAPSRAQGSPSTTTSVRSPAINTKRLIRKSLDSFDADLSADLNPPTATGQSNSTGTPPKRASGKMNRLTPTKAAAGAIQSHQRQPSSSQSSPSKEPEAPTKDPIETSLAAALVTSMNGHEEGDED